MFNFDKSCKNKNKKMLKYIIRYRLLTDGKSEEYINTSKAY